MYSGKEMLRRRAARAAAVAVFGCTSRFNARTAFPHFPFPARASDIGGTRPRERASERVQRVVIIEIRCIRCEKSTEKFSNSQTYAVSSFLTRRATASLTLSCVIAIRVVKRFPSEFYPGNLFSQRYLLLKSMVEI